MNQPSAETLDSVFAALTAYNTGSGRAALLPIDQAVAAGLPSNLETRLLGVLDKSPSDPACEYIFSKLALIGTLKSLPVLAKAAASEVPSATAARTAMGNLQSRSYACPRPPFTAIFPCGQRGDLEFPRRPTRP